MSSDAFELVGRISLEGGRRVEQGLKDVNESAGNTAKRLGKGGLGGSMKKAGRGLLTVGKYAGGAAAAGISVLGGFVGNTGLQFNAMREQSQVAWETLLGTSEAADEMIGRINDFAKKTPFANEQVDMMAKYMNNAGYEGQAMFDELMKISDTASAFALGGSEAQEMARQMSQVQQAGVAYTEDLNILQDRGIPIFTALAEVTGTNAAEVKKMAGEGKITADVYNEAFSNIAKNVEGASDAQSETLNGMISTLKDNFGMLAGELSEGAFQFLKGILPDIIEGVEWLTETIQEKGIAGAFKEFLPAPLVEGIIGAIDFIKQGIGFLGDMFNNEGGLGGASLIVDGIMQAFQNLKEIVMFVFELIAPFIMETITKIREFWAENGEQIMTAVQNFMAFLQAIFNAVFPIIKWIVEDVWTNIKNIISGVLDVILGLIKVFTGIFTGDFSLAWEGIKQIFSGALQAIWGFINTMLIGKILGKLKKFGSKALKPFTDLKDKAVEAFKTLSNKIDEVIESIIGWFKNLGENMKIKIPSFKLPRFKLEGKLDLVPPDISVPKLSVDWYAKGGIFNKPTIAGLGEQGAEAILPIQDKNAMAPFADAIAERLGGAGGRIEIPVILNGREIARATAEDMNRELKRQKTNKYMRGF